MLCRAVLGAVLRCAGLVESVDLVPCLALPRGGGIERGVRGANGVHE